jgi:hypothetical protein
MPAAASYDDATLLEHDVARDVSGWFVGAGLALLAVASSLSLLWFQRLP